MKGSLRTQKLLPALLIFVALIVGCTLGFPANLVVNGDFEWQYFDLDTTELNHIDITSNNNALMPYYRVVHKGIQILKAYAYHAPGDFNSGKGKLLCHLNTKRGPGVLQTTNLPTPRKGAPLTLQFLMADNPDGGELIKALRVSILVNNRVAQPKIPPYKVSNPYSTQSTIDWRVKNATFVGTGEPTKLQFESLMPGSFGPLIDNISVTVQTLVENGSFENTTTVNQNIFTGVVIISSPSQDIPGWFVKSGKIKWMPTFQYQQATDRSSNFIDLNAEATAGTIASNPFTTKPGKMYTVLFDTAANAANIPAVKGYMSASAFSYPGGTLLASRSVFVTSEGYDPMDLGWTSYVLEFKAHETQSFVQFSSQTENTWGGPLLDNVVVYEVHKPRPFKHVAPTWSAGRHVESSVWTFSLAAALVMCVFGQF